MMKRKLPILVSLGVAGALWFRHRESPLQAPRSTPVETRTAHTTEPTLAVVTSRAPEEWQGMPVDKNQPLCDTSERCGLAMACVAGRCGGCTADRDCANGEACVLDHCVRPELVACHTRAECNDGELCVLSGISSDARGNADMRAYCQGATTAIAQSREAYDANQRVRVGIPAPPREITASGLLDTL